MNDEDHKKRKYILLAVIALIIAFLAFLLAQNAQTTADNNANITNVFEIVVNNTDLGSLGTMERVKGTKYHANEYPIYIEILTHTVNTGQDIVFNFSINDTVVWEYSKRSAIQDEHHSMVQIVPKFSSYELNASSSIHHYEWREYPILSGRNGTLSINQTFINSFNSTYDATTNAFNSNYSSQTFPNLSIVNNNNTLTSSKVNKTGDNMTGMLFIDSTTNLKNTAPGAPFNSTMTTGARGNFVFVDNWNESNVKDNVSYQSVAFGISANPPTGLPLFFISTQDIGVNGNALAQQFQVFNTTTNVVQNLTLLTAGKVIILKSPDGTKCGTLEWTNAGGFATTSITCP